MMRFTDTIQLQGGMRETRDGYLAATGRIARGGNVQRYTGEEMGRPDLDVVDVYRPDSEVFDLQALQSFAHRPITNDHPNEAVTADNWSEFAKGYTGDKIARDGEYIRVPLLLTDAAIIAAVKAGKQEFSAGYDAEIDWTPGMTPGGLKYDAIQRNIRANHVALVDRGRAGPDARIGDRGAPHDKRAPKQEDEQMTQKVIVDGISIETTEQGAQAIDKLRGMVADAGTKLADAETKHTAAIAAKDKELAGKDAEIEKLKAQVMTADAMDKAIADRVALIDKAKRIADLDYTGKTPAQIRAMAVQAKAGEAAVKDRSEAYIEARFDALMDAAPADTGAGTTQDRATDDNGQAAYEKRISDAWRDK